MPQPFREIELALERRELVNPALNYDPASRTHPVIRMQPLQSIAPPAVIAPDAPVRYRVINERRGLEFGGGPGPAAALLGLVDLLRLPLCPAAWIVAALLVYCYQLGAENRPVLGARPAAAQTAPVAKQAPAHSGAQRQAATQRR